MWERQMRMNQDAANLHSRESKLASEAAAFAKNLNGFKKKNKPQLSVGKKNRRLFSISGNKISLQGRWSDRKCATFTYRRSKVITTMSYLNIFKDNLRLQIVYQYLSVSF